MSNVISLHGAMHPRHYVRAGRVTEADLDAQIASHRHDRYAEYFAHKDRLALQAAIARTLSRPAEIQTDNSLRARLIRWVRSLNLKGARP